MENKSSPTKENNYFHNDSEILRQLLQTQVDGEVAHRNRTASHCAQSHRDQLRRSTTERKTRRRHSKLSPLAKPQEPLFASLASLPGFPETSTSDIVLDRFTKTGVSPHDPSTLRRTAYTLVSSNCIQGERRLTYLVELTETGPNVRPTFPVLTPLPTTDSSSPTDLRVTLSSTSPTQTFLTPSSSGSSKE